MLGSALLGSALLASAVFVSAGLVSAVSASDERSGAELVRAPHRVQKCSIPLTGDPHCVQNLIGGQPSLKFMSMAVSLTSCGSAGSGSRLAASIPASVDRCMAVTSARVDSKRSERWIPSPRLVRS